MQQVPSYVGGRWAAGGPNAQTLVNPATEEPLASASSEGIDLAAALEYAKSTGGPALRALTFADRSVSPEVDQVSRQTTVIILDAMGLENPTPEQLSAVRVIEHTWHSALITWLSGRASIAQVKIDIETVCRLIDLTDTGESGEGGGSGGSTRHG